MTLIIFLVLFSGVPLTANAPQSAERHEFVIIGGNSVKPVQIPITAKLASYGVNYVNNDALIARLIECESSGNPEAIGSQGEKGLLQFKSRTFYYYAEMYGLELDIWNPEHQIQLADLMLQDNLGWNWTCFQSIK